MSNPDFLRKRLLYQSQHRGMQEMDLLLGRFAQRYLTTMNAEELEQFQALLAFPDQDLYGLFFEKTPIPQNGLQSLVYAIHQFIENP